MTAANAAVILSAAKDLLTDGSAVIPGAAKDLLFLSGPKSGFFGRYAASE